MIRMERYIPEHFNKIVLRDCHAREKIGELGPADAFTFFHGDEVVAIVGGIDVIPGVMQTWGLLSDGVKNCAVSFTRSAKLLSDEYLRGNYRRLQMSVRQDYEEGWRWAKALGFQSEGSMRKYGPDGTDYIMFSKVSR